MKTSLHLISMPMVFPLHPSCQLGYLHGYFEKEYKDKIQVSSHSAFWDILYGLEGEKLIDFYMRYRFNGEELFFLVNCASDFNADERLKDVLKDYNAHYNNRLNISSNKINALKESTDNFLDQFVLPTLDDNCINIVGFTTTFAQLFASIYAANYIKQNTNKDVLFVFGGASTSVPEASTTMFLWGVDGLVIAGNGEEPLAEVLNACLSASQSSSEDIIATIVNKGFANISRAGSGNAIKGKNISKSNLEKIPLPNYDEYFAKLKMYCDDDEVYQKLIAREVSIPIEGSRGCFARCDFCQIPNVTTEFQSLTGKNIANRAIELCTKYNKADVVFVDAVCNTWAEAYADELIAKDIKIGSFMEMRVHCPETFWTKMAMTGVREMQLGIEAVSEPLLKKMNKGTKVIQNLSASKYMAELGVHSSSNIIIQHPKSSLEDVRETRRILSILEHFPNFMFSYFIMSHSSPIYFELNEKRRNELVFGFEWLENDLKPFSFLKDLGYAYPVEWLPLELYRAWNSLEEWYDNLVAKHAKNKPIFTVIRSSMDELEFRDTRFGKDLQYKIYGIQAQIYDLCHTGLTIRQIALEIDLDESIIAHHLDGFVERFIMIQVNNRYLSIAFRPREYLLKKLNFKDSEEVVQTTGYSF